MKIRNKSKKSKMNKTNKIRKKSFQYVFTRKGGSSSDRRSSKGSKGVPADAESREGKGNPVRGSPAESGLAVRPPGVREPRVSIFNRDCISVKRPPSISLISYERQMVQIKMSIFGVDGKTVLYEMEHIISGDLKETMNSFMLELNKLQKQRHIPPDYSMMKPSERTRLRMFAMIPKIIADTSASWHVGEYIRQHNCVLKSDPLKRIETRELACMVINYDTDTETFWFSDALVFNKIPSTDFYSGNAFSFIKSEILNMMTSLADLGVLKEEYQLLGDELIKLTQLYEAGLVNMEEVLACKKIIEDEFKKVGTFTFNYRQKGKTNMVFKGTEEGSGVSHIQLENDEDNEDTPIRHIARKNAYLYIIHILVRPEELEDATEDMNARFDNFESCKTMKFMFLPLGCLFREMFGMNDQFFENMRFNVLESVSKMNHDQARDPRVNALCEAEYTPIRNLAFFKVVDNGKGPHVVWIHSMDARSVAKPGIGGCVSIANGDFPLDLQDKDLVSSIPLETYPGVYTCCPSAKASTPKRVISSCFDSQRPIERLPSNQPFFHTTPIENLTFKGSKLLGDVEDENDESMVVYAVTYIGTPELIIARDNEPLKTYGLVYLTEDGDVMKVEGTKPSYFESLILLLEMKKRGTVYIPELVLKCLDDIFEEVEGKPKVYTKDARVKQVKKYIKDNVGANESLQSLLSILDSKFGNTYSAGVFQHQIDKLTRMTAPVCLMPPRQTSFGPREKYITPANPKPPAFPRYKSDNSVLSRYATGNALNEGAFSQSSLHFSQRSEYNENAYLAPAPLAPAPLAPAPLAPAPSRGRRTPAPLAPSRDRRNASPEPEQVPLAPPKSRKAKKK